MDENESVSEFDLEQDHVDLVQVAEGLAPLLRREAAATEDARRLTVAAHSAFVTRGLYRLMLPTDLGGAGATLPESMRVFEALARGDASSAWAVWAACAVPSMSAHLPAEGARELFEAPDAYVACSFAGVGKASVAANGYRVTGAWKFVSGIAQATYAGGHCFVFDGDVPRQGPDGSPLRVLAFWPIDGCTVTDVWDTTGLRGTGSNDMAVREVHVPDRLILDVTTPPRAGMPLLHYLDMDNTQNLTVAAIALGVAGGAIESFREIAAVKRNSAGLLLGETALAKAMLPSAEARLAQAREELFGTAEAMWTQLAASTHHDEAWRPRTSLASVAAVDAAIDVVVGIYRTAGTSAILRTSALERCLRDVFTIAAHRTVQPGIAIKYGSIT